MVLSEEEEREVERLKNVVIKPRWSADPGARSMAIDRIATYGSLAVPALNEISERTDDSQIRKQALNWLTKLSLSLRPETQGASPWS